VKARLCIAALAIAGAGWDTHGHYDVPGEPQWTSMYVGLTDLEMAEVWRNGAADPELLEGNEHAELAHIALLQLGWRDALYGTEMPEIVDLNASVWHADVREVSSGLTDEGDVAATPLLERRLPHPARWAGVADFSYTVYDWLNRNLECPALPDSEPTADQCHVYKEWLGAALNSSHFGEQATKMYLRLHAIALALGAQAGAMRAALDRNVDDADAAPIEDMIREAELEALAYEGYAQHFLHDRWSSGHMWSRYSTPEYQGPGTLDLVKAAGGFSGLIHGAEAVLNQIDPMDTWAPDSLCSPQMEDNLGADVAIPMTYLDGDGLERTGIGDYRLEDAVDGAFGANYDYDDAPIDVHQQLEDMMLCSRAGWADVARGFGVNPDGTVGLLGLPVDGSATFDAAVAHATENGDTIACFGQWATNASMVVALNDPLKPSFFDLLDSLFSGTMSWGGDLLSQRIGVDLADLGKAYFAIQRHGRDNPTLTDLADGSALPSVVGIDPGSAYLDQVPPSYTEPAPASGGDVFEDLPMHAPAWDLPATGDRPGRDKHTLQGYFHQAHAGAWCEAAQEVLTDPADGLRWPVPLPSGQNEELARRADACVMLADRLFDRTHAWYRDDLYLGTQREYRRAGHGDANAANARPACETLEALPPGVHGTDLPYWDDNPFELHPGYVSAAAGPYATVPFYGDAVYRSIVSWCESRPVVHVDDDDVAVDDLGAPIAVHPGFRDDGTLSFDPDVRDPEVVLHGLHFGSATGQVALESESGCVTDPPVSHFADIVSWSDAAITIRVPHTRFVPDHYAITILRADRLPDGTRVRSVGRARLDIQRAAFGEVGSTTAPLPTDVTGQYFAALYPFCAGATVTSHRVHDCTGVDETACGSDGGPGTLLWADGVPGGYTPGPFAEHQWAVTQTAACSALPGWVVCMPQYPTSYGMVYRVERTSTAPVTETPKRWRWTLIWQRPGPF
jgi:hypothetical protein